MLKKINLLLIVILIFGAAAGSISAQVTVNAGTWEAYSTGGKLDNPNYKIKILKTADYISVSFAGNTGYYATITGNQIRLTNYDPVGTISADGNRIDWNNRTYWVRHGAVMGNTLNSGNLNGTYRFKRNNGTLVDGIPPLEITQNGANVFVTANQINRFQTQIIDDSVFLGELMAVIEQNGNILRTRGGYFQRDGYAGPIGTGTGVPRLQAQCTGMLQGKVAIDRNGNTRWAEGELERLCTGTSNPPETVACFQNVLGRLGETDKSIQTCSFLAKWKSQPNNGLNPTSSATININGDWIGYYPDGTKSPYIWQINQNDASLTFQDVGGTGTKFTGFLGQWGKITDTAGKSGTVSADHTRITWSDGVVYLKQTAAAVATPKPTPQPTPVRPPNQTNPMTQPPRPAAPTNSTVSPSANANSLSGQWTRKPLDGSIAVNKIAVVQSGSSLTVYIDGKEIFGSVSGTKFMISGFQESATIESANRLRWTGGDVWEKNGTGASGASTAADSRQIEPDPVNPVAKQNGSNNPPLKSTPPAAPRKSLDEQCFDLVQENLPYPYNENKNAAAANTRNICLGTKNPAATQTCFNFVMARENNWEKTIQTCQQSAVNIPPDLANLSGKWDAYDENGNKAANQAGIFQNGKLLYINNGQGSATEGKFFGLELQAYAWRVTGLLTEAGHTIVWSNNTVWRR